MKTTGPFLLSSILLVLTCVHRTAHGQSVPPTITIVVTTNTYHAFRTDLPGGAWVFVDADPAAGSPVRALVPSQNRVILGHIVANYFAAMAGPQPVTDARWTARAAENNALLYGPNGDLLTLPGEPN